MWWLVAGGEFEFFWGGAQRGKGGKGGEWRWGYCTTHKKRKCKRRGLAFYERGGGEGGRPKFPRAPEGTRPFGTPSGAPGTASLGIPTELRPGDPLGSPGAGSPWGRPGYSPVGIPRAREARGALGE